MAQLGKYNILTASRKEDFGLYLKDAEGNEILLPKRYVTPEMRVGDELEVFVYNDSEDRPVATTERPYATVGDFALLRVKSVNKVGAFLDWGLMKDLLVPFREQKMRMVPGRSYIVYVYLDDSTQRIVASAKLDKFLDNKIPHYKPRQAAEALVAKRTDLGYKVVLDKLFWGMLYHEEIFQEINIGDRLTVYVKNVRDDGKIDVTLSDREVRRVKSLAGAVLEFIQRHGGVITVTDKSSPEVIHTIFSCSKKDYKKALGSLYKAKKILILPDEIRLV